MLTRKTGSMTDLCLVHNSRGTIGFNDLLNLEERHLKDLRPNLGRYTDGDGERSCKGPPGKPSPSTLGNVDTRAQTHSTILTKFVGRNQ